MKCPQCRFENRKGAKFCNECGHKFDCTCPKCHTSNSVSSKFCDECGYDLRRAEVVPTIHKREAPSYTPKFLAEKILTTRSSIEGERKLVTVLFADVANYTAIAEMLDPEEVHEIIDGCFKILMNEIHRYEGTINQFTGDGIMAIFGAPVAHEDHAQRACYASLAIQKALGDYAGRLKQEHDIDFKMRIGINSGPVVVGAIGDDLRMDYTAVGDTTNLAARMEREARPGSIFVSKNLHLIAKDYFDFLPLGKMEIKGKKKPQEAYELIRVGEEKTRLKALAARGLTKFVGRANSMAALMDPFERALTGSGQVVGIAGEAGVGKSRLLLELINQLPKAEFICLGGRCLRYGETILYMPILEILRSYFDIKEKDRDPIINRKINAKIPYYLSLHYFALGMVQLASGNFKASQASFNRAFELSHSHNEKWIEGTAQIYLGITIAQDNKSQIETAEKTMLAGIEILDDRKIKPWSSIGYYILGLLQAQRGKMEQARIHLDTAERMFTEMGMNYWLSLTRRAGDIG